MTQAHYSLVPTNPADKRRAETTKRSEILFTVLSLLPEQPLFLCFPVSMAPQYVIYVKERTFNHYSKKIYSKSFSIVRETPDRAIFEGKTHKGLQWKVTIKKTKLNTFTADIIVGIHSFPDRILSISH